MTIEYKTGNLLAEKADALVNTVNCVGHMGAGFPRFESATPPMAASVFGQDPWILPPSFREGQNPATF